MWQLVCTPRPTDYCVDFNQPLCDKYCFCQLFQTIYSCKYMTLRVLFLLLWCGVYRTMIWALWYAFFNTAHNCPVLKLLLFDKKYIQLFIFQAESMCILEALWIIRRLYVLQHSQNSYTSIAWWNILYPYTSSSWIYIKIGITGTFSQH